MTEENKQKIIDLVHRLYLFKNEVSDDVAFLQTLDKISYILKNEDDR